jgi:hypothetical protein
MQKIVTGSFVDFAGAARCASALVAAGFVHGEVSIIARRPGPPLLSAAALLAGAVGALVAPGSMVAWTSDARTLFDVAPSFGAAAGACVGVLAAVLADRRSRARAEEVRVVVDSGRVARAEQILRSCGASIRRLALRSHPAAIGARPLRLVPYRP